MELKPVPSLETPRYVGISTFFRLPHLTDPSGLDAAVLGVPFDGGQSLRTGSRFAPSEIRRMSCNIKPYNPSLGINPYDYLKVADLGDSSVNPLDPTLSRELIQKSVARIVDVSAIPISIGGDHSIILPILRAVAHKYGPLALIQVDSHLDTGDTYFGIKYGGGTAFRRAVEENLIDTDKWVQIGIHGSMFGDDYFDFVREHGVRCVTMDQIQANGMQWALEQLDHLRNTACYVTFDIDAIDPAFAPGVTGPEPGGLTSLQALMLVRHLRQFTKLVGFDTVEVQPMYDVGSITSTLAAILAFEFLGAYAVARRDRRANDHDNRSRLKV